MGVAARREKEKLERRESILVAASELFYEKSYQDTTVEEIAEAAQVSKGTVYLYFGSKDELYVSVVIEGFQILEEKLEAIMVSDRGVVEKGKSVFMAFVDHCLEHREYFRITQYFLSENARKNLPHGLIDDVSGYTSKLLGYVAGLVQEGIEAGVIRDDVDPFVFALIAWRMATGIMDLAIVDDEVGAEAGPYRELFERAIEWLIRGASVETGQARAD